MSFHDVQPAFTASSERSFWSLVEMSVTHGNASNAALTSRRRSPQTSLGGSTVTAPDAVSSSTARGPTPTAVQGWSDLASDGRASGDMSADTGAPVARCSTDTEYSPAPATSSVDRMRR